MAEANTDVDGFFECEDQLAPRSPVGPSVFLCQGTPEPLVEGCPRGAATAWCDSSNSFHLTPRTCMFEDHSIFFSRIEAISFSAASLVGNLFPIAISPVQSVQSFSIPLDVLARVPGAQ